MGTADRRQGLARASSASCSASHRAAAPWLWVARNRACTPPAGAPGAARPAPAGETPAWASLWPRGSAWPWPWACWWGFSAAGRAGAGRRGRRRGAGCGGRRRGGSGRHRAGRAGASHGGRHLDHRHRVAVAVGDVAGVGGGVHRHPQRPSAHGDGGDDRVRRPVDHRHRGGPEVGDVAGAAGGATAPASPTRRPRRRDRARGGPLGARRGGGGRRGNGGTLSNDAGDSTACRPPRLRRLLAGRGRGVARRVGGRGGRRHRRDADPHRIPARKYVVRRISRGTGQPFLVRADLGLHPEELDLAAAPSPLWNTM